MTSLARSLVLAAPRRLEWAEEPLGEPATGMVLVRTLAGAISIGSELPHYAGASRTGPAHYPRMTGYESLGVVEAIGPGVERVRAGERVVAFYGHRTAASVPEQKAILVPDDIPDALALLTILTCDAAKGVRRVAPSPAEPALLTGAGAMGLFTLFMLKAYGVENVDVVEPDAQRRELARMLGARDVLLPDVATTGQAPYAVGFECSARDAAFGLLQGRVAPGGQICVLSDGNVEPLTLTPAFHEKELRAVGSSDGWDYQQHSAWYFDYVKTTATQVADVFQLEVAADALPETFERLARGEITPAKVLVRYG
jgi:alcohol dehydrogenase